MRGPPSYFQEPMPESFTPLLAPLLDDLVRDGYSVRPGFFPPAWSADARAEIAAWRERFARAGIGQGGGTRTEDGVRKDLTRWWEPEALSGIQARYWGEFERLREELNRSLFLGLRELEGHYAIYAPGAFYRRHLDRFRGDSRRTVSLVAFFNEGWSAADGGLLRIECPRRGTVDVLPEAGTLVAFLSAEVLHEVTETKRERFSFAGWMKTAR